MKGYNVDMMIRGSSTPRFIVGFPLVFLAMWTHFGCWLGNWNPCFHGSPTWRITATFKTSSLGSPSIEMRPNAHGLLKITWTDQTISLKTAETLRPLIGKKLVTVVSQTPFLHQQKEWLTDGSDESHNRSGPTKMIIFSDSGTLTLVFQSDILTTVTWATMPLTTTRKKAAK